MTEELENKNPEEKSGNDTGEKIFMEKVGETKPGVQLPDPASLIISSSPHVHDPRDVRKIMYLVLLALAPACIAGIIFFGLEAVRVLVLCSVFCVFVEVAWCWVARKPLDTWRDGSALVTGVLLGMNLWAGIPWWACLVGAFLAIGLGKQIYGGLGHNPFNPALVARVGLLIGFPKLMTTWTPSRYMPYEKYGKLFSYSFDKSRLSEQVIDSIKGMHTLPFAGGLDGVTCATPLGIITTTKELAKDAGANGYEMATNAFNEISRAGLYWDYFWGNMGGSLGETSAFALLIGGIFLLCLRLIRWQTPVAYVGTVAVFSAIVHYIDPAQSPDPLFQVLTGGLLIGAFFMATDMVTSPMTGTGAFISGIGCGIVTSCIRLWGNYPEGVSFSILFMNAWCPLIDRLTRKRPFGFKKPEKEGTKK